MRPRSEDATMAIGPQVLDTAEEFGRRPDPGYPEELVRGQIVPMPIPGARQGEGLPQHRLSSSFLEEIHNRGLIRTGPVAAAAPPRHRAFLAAAPAAGAPPDARS